MAIGMIKLRKEKGVTKTIMEDDETKERKKINGYLRVSNMV